MASVCLHLHHIYFNSNLQMGVSSRTLLCHTRLAHHSTISMTHTSHKEKERENFLIIQFFPQKKKIFLAVITCHVIKKSINRP